MDPIKVAIVKEQASWRGWCLGLAEQPIPQILVDRAEAEQLSRRQCVELGWNAVIQAMIIELRRSLHEG